MSIIIHTPKKRVPFPLCWDNTMRSSFVECPQKAFWQYFQHFKGGGEISTDLHAGKAFAAGLETARREFYDNDKDEATAFAIGLDTLCDEYGDFIPPPHKMTKSLDRLIQAFAYYRQAFPLETDPVQPFRKKDGSSMVEFSFALPIEPEILRHPETDEPLIYTGRADMIATYAGALSVYDDKTTSQLGPKWGNQWNRRAQFTGYTWAAQAYNIPVTQVIVRGIAILKTEINHAQAITSRLPHHVGEWHYQLIRDLQRAIQCWKDNYFDVNLSDACGAYGGCMFQQPCMAKDPQPWLETNFIRKVWDPLARTETTILPEKQP